MIPRLEAEESIAASEQIAIGTGAATASRRADVIKRWERLAGADTPRPPSAPALFSPEVYARLPVRRVTKGKANA